MASLQVLCFLFSILCVSSIQGTTKTIRGGDRPDLDCPRYNHVQITNVEFSLFQEIKPSQKKLKTAWENLQRNQDQIKNNIKKFCQRKRSCTEKLPIDFDGQDVNRVQTKIEFNCISQGCPHPRFLDKHIMRFVGAPPANMNTEADKLARERAQLNAVTTNVMDLFVDPREYMEYVRGKDSCKFKTGAQKYHCTKNVQYNSWHCEYNGEAIAYHDPATGHYQRSLPAPA